MFDTLARSLPKPRQCKAFERSLRLRNAIILHFSCLGQQENIYMKLCRRDFRVAQAWKANSLQMLQTCPWKEEYKKAGKKNWTLKKSLPHFLFPFFHFSLVFCRLSCFAEHSRFSKKESAPWSAAVANAKKLLHQKKRLHPALFLLSVVGHSLQQSTKISKASQVDESQSGSFSLDIWHFMTASNHCRSLCHPNLFIYWVTKQTVFF